MDELKVSSPVSQVEQKVPVAVTVISWLMMFLGLSNFGALVGSLMLAFQSSLIAHSGGEDLFSSITPKMNINYVNVGISVLLGIGLIVAGYGLGRMRKWALYVFTALSVTEVIYVFYSFMNSPKQNINALLLPVIELLVLIYLWSISKKFN